MKPRANGPKAVIDRQFKGEIASTMDKLTSKPLLSSYLMVPI